MTHTFFDLARPWVDFGTLVSLFKAILSDTLHPINELDTVKKGCRATEDHRNFWRIKDFRIKKELSSLILQCCNTIVFCCKRSRWKSMSVLYELNFL